MSSIQLAVNSTIAPVFQRHGVILTIFTMTLFTSALLLFGIQPLFAKMVLPKLGGSPTVWSIALVFFQGVLLLGYTYAHFLSAKLPMKQAIGIHLVVLLLALFWLPIAFPAGWNELPESGVSLWLMGLFAAGVGFPFFAVSANAPLLQSWFSKSGHPHSEDPYFLYGASNIGSFVALVCYPFVLEPLTALGTQSWVWTTGYIVLFALVTTCGTAMYFLGANVHETSLAAKTGNINDTAPPLTWGERATWVGLALVPSGLLVGVTAYITSDLVAAPFLWVIPLALFLVTFVITFSRNPIIPHALSERLHAFFVAPVALLMFSPFTGIYMLPLHLAAFFISAMVCHGELVKRRPAAAHLTEFYLWMSFGGVLGGVFASIISPNLFDRVLEYPILMMAVFMCRGDFWYHFKKASWQDGVLFVILGLLLAIGNSFAGSFPLERVIFPAALILTAGIIINRNNSANQAAFVGAGIMMVLSFGIAQYTIDQSRSFFGVNGVVAHHDGKHHILTHGTTSHGAEKRFDDNGAALTGRPTPLTYYYDEGPIAVAIDRLRSSTGGTIENAALIGLGSGAMACHRQENEKWRYFEIDPEVVKIARNPDYFSFLSKCGESDGIVLGDGRITLEKEADKKFDLIVLDAFSSDSIPVHLLTREAMELYFSKLTDRGALLFHISNRYMELGSVVSAIAKEQGAQTFITKHNEVLWNGNREAFKIQPLVALVSKNQKSLEPFAKSNRWFTLGAEQYSTVWTDDYSNILGAIWRAYSTGRVPAEHRVN